MCQSEQKRSPIGRSLRRGDKAHDLQYATGHPEEHAAKEEIYENMMTGCASALDEKLAALGNTQEDYLPSEIKKFKDATGYEKFLDVDHRNPGSALCGRDAALCGTGKPGV